MTATVWQGQIACCIGWFLVKHYNMYTARKPYTLLCVLEFVPVGDSDDDDEYDNGQQMHAFGTWRSPVLLPPAELPPPRIHWGTPPRAAQRYSNQHADEDMPDADSDTDASGADAPTRPAAMRVIRQAWQRASRRTAAQPAQQQQQQAEIIGQSLPLLRVEQCQGPGACSFLQRGVVFEGSQKLSQFGMRRREEQWSVRVLIEVRLEGGCL